MHKLKSYLKILVLWVYDKANVKKKKNLDTISISSLTAVQVI